MPGKMKASLNKKLSAVKWGEYELGSLFNIESTLSFNADRLVDGTEYDYITRTSINQGILQSTGFVNKENINRIIELLNKEGFYYGEFIKQYIKE